MQIVGFPMRQLNYCWYKRAQKLKTTSLNIHPHVSGSGADLKSVKKNNLAYSRFLLYHPNQDFFRVSEWTYKNYTILFSIDKLEIIMSSYMRKPTFCICKNKDADQLCSNCTADQRLRFGFTYSTIPLLLKSKISSF